MRMHGFRVKNTMRIPVARLVALRYHLFIKTTQVHMSELASQTQQ
jgi:hypothetical protein